MSWITLQQAQLAYGHWPLLDKVDFSLNEQERVGLIGRNGAGKSSLLRILAGLEQPDDGQVQATQGLLRAYVEQEARFAPELTVFDAVAAGLGQVREWIRQYESGQGDLDRLQNLIETHHGWNLEQRVTETLQRLRLNPQALMGALSGGTAKRVALARALVQAPDVLLLDEPTNHLDLDSIAWLEDLLLEFRGSLVVITHDRAFLDRIATRIIELDRGRLWSYPGNYAQYRAQKDEQLAQEAVISAKADKLLAGEEVWVRKGVEARRTRSQSRVRRLEALREQRAQRREQVGQVRMEVSAGTPSGKLVAELTGVNQHFVRPDGQPLWIARELDFTVLRGDKVGLIGPNGAGKTSLLKLILGELSPQSGQVRRGSNLQVAYFDQQREQLDLDATLEDFISPGSEWIEIGSRRQHVKSYLGDFLFSPARATSPVRSLSGGERNRLLLARLFARPANVLVLDEPTNDLDIETLELLEQLVQDYEGTVFIVSHDRAFLDQVVTSTLVFEGDGKWREYEGSVQDWLTQSQRAALWAQAAGKTAASRDQAVAPAADLAAHPPDAAPADAKVTRNTRKLSYKEQRELEGLPAKMEALEQEQQQLRTALAEPDIYTRDPMGAARMHERDAAIEDELMQCLVRWEELGS
jgi:ATP-binding cassette subfamily F protein uup